MKAFCLADSWLGTEVLIASSFSPSFLTHAAEPGFNGLDTKRTDTARATSLRRGRGNGAEVRIGCSAPVWRPNLGTCGVLPAGPQLPGVTSGGAHGCTHRPSTLLGCPAAPGWVTTGTWVTTSVWHTVEMGTEVMWRRVRGGNAALRVQLRQSCLSRHLRELSPLSSAATASSRSWRLSCTATRWGWSIGT